VTTLRRLIDRLAGRRDPAPADPPPPPPAPPAPPPPPDSGFWTRASDRPLSSLSDDELIALENANIPTIGRQSDATEAAADELQNPLTSLNFPLHWTSAAESWRYLYDLAIACDLLGARPDDVVLDFAAGTCWASECLLRLGLRPVAVDLSIEMMRRGRQRLGADTRLVFRDEARFVTARGQQLPFRNETFDGVLCMNALHHMPSYLEALREIYRILKPGGRAVFSEPGTGHADEALSRYRMREEQVMEKSVSLPLIRHLAAKAGFSRMRVVPLRASSTYAIDYDGSPETSRLLDGKWTETIRHAPTEHARFALYKGDAPPDDTLLPAPLLVGRLGAVIVVAAGELTVQAGQTVTQRLSITNAGTLTWKARGRRFGGQVTCGLKVFTEDGRLVREDLGRTPLPRDVGPGEAIDIEMTIQADLAPGRYRLLHDMVVEGVSWFEHYGSATPRRGLVVVP
jgi:SAM-dependent methyltransferase